MSVRSRAQFLDARDARRGRLANPVLLEAFMQARQAALRNGASISMANAAGHEAVDAKALSNVP